MRANPDAPQFKTRLIQFVASCACARHFKCPPSGRDQMNGWPTELLTSRLGFAASTIGRIHKERWQIELFFKALNQNQEV